MTLALTLPKENRFVTYTDWDGYLKYLDAVGESRNVRITFDRGALEIMTTSNEHEAAKTVIGSLIEYLALHLGTPLAGAGHMTFQRQDLDKGLEPDECYWIASTDRLPTAGYEYPRDPPPDLVVEVDITRRSINRMEIYKSMGVAEVWRYDRRKGLLVYHLSKAGRYERCLTSPTFPQIPLAEIQRHLEMRKVKHLYEIMRCWRAWLQEKFPV